MDTSLIPSEEKLKELQNDIYKIRGVEAEFQKLGTILLNSLSDLENVLNILLKIKKGGG